MMLDQLINAPRVTVSPKTFASLLEDAREVYNFTEEELPVPVEKGSRWLFYEGIIITEGNNWKETK